LSDLKKIRELFAGDHYKIINNMLSNS